MFENLICTLNINIIYRLLVPFIPDRRAYLNIIDMTAYERVQDKVQPQSAAAELFAYGKDKWLAIKGKVQTRLGAHGNRLS